MDLGGAPEVAGGVSAKTLLSTIGLLIGSNVFMTFAWYGLIKPMAARPLYIVIAASWGIAFFEYCLQVPANRIGATGFSIAQLRIIQEVVSLGVFVAFLSIYLKEPLKLDYLWAGICLVGAVYFVFKGLGTAAV
ncbi:DMT family protein [soil metagenome]